jgi:hypothetical protein
LSRAAWESGQGDLREHLRRELMRPLGIPDGAWSMGYGKAMPWDGVPVYDLAGGGQATGRALAVLRAMVTAGGRRDGANVLARHWIEEIATATTASLPSDGTVRNSVYGRAVESQPAMAWVKRSPKRTANWALAIAHSRGGILHAFSARFKTRKRSFIAASSVGKWPLARTARRSLEFSASMAFVTGMMLLALP